MITPGADRSRAYRERKRAEGFRLVKGRLTRAPRRELVPMDEHSVRGYWRGCRCPVCRAGRAEYDRDRKAIR